VTDNDGASSAPAQVSVTVAGVNDAPVATPQTVGAVEDEAKAITLGGADGDGTIVSHAVTRPPAHGTVSGAWPNVVYRPEANFNGTDSFEFTVTDNDGASSAPAQVSVTVAGVNDAPVATPQTVGAVEDEAKAIALGGTDGDGTIVSHTVTRPPAHGTVSGAWPNVVYRPEANFNGTDSFEFTVTDNDGASSAPALLSVTVAAVNDPPSFSRGTDQRVALNSGASTVRNWATEIRSGPADESAQTLSFIVSNSSPALFSEQPAVSPDGTLTFTPAADRSGAATVTLRLRDNGASGDGGLDTSEAQEFAITVEGLATAPLQFDAIGNLALREDAGTQTVPITGIVAGAGAVLSASSDNPSLLPAPSVVYAGGTETSLLLKPGADASGNATITVRLAPTAGGAPAFSRTFEVSVASVNDAPTFEPGGDVVMGKETLKGAAAQSVEWARGLKPGPADESGQRMEFETVLENGAELFEEVPVIAADGKLRFRPRLNTAGRATVKTRLKDDGAADGGGVNASEWSSFAIILTDVSLLSGSYNGLVRAPAGVQATYENSGRLNVELRKTGSFTVRLEVGAEVFSAAGTLDHLGRATFGKGRTETWTVTRRKAPSLSVELGLDTAYGTDSLTGRVKSGMTTLCEGVAERRVRLGADRAGRYTALFEPSEDPVSGVSQAPKGMGWGTLTADGTGCVKLVGSLADGTSLSCSGFVSRQSRWALYARPSSGKAKTGLVSGWVELADRPGVSDMEGADLRWFRFAAPRDKRLPTGWSAGLRLLGSRYTAPTANGSRPLLTGLSPAGNNARMTLSQGGRPAPQAFEVALKWPFSVRGPGVQLRVEGGTGRFSGSVAGAKEHTASFSGVIFQKRNIGAGFWLSATSAGRMDLEVLRAPGPHGAQLTGAPPEGTPP
jgi:hypothetical protein